MTRHLAVYKTNDARFEGMTVDAVANREGIHPRTLRSRLSKNPNTPIELLVYKAREQPSVKRVTYRYKDSDYDSLQLASIAKCSLSSMEERLKVYDTVEEAVEAVKGAHRTKNKDKNSKTGWGSQAPAYDPDIESKRRIQSWLNMGMTEEEIATKIKNMPRGTL